MADRFKFAEVRQEVIEMLKKDLLGPSSENEILNQNPRFEYIVGRSLQIDLKHRLPLASAFT